MKNIVKALFIVSSILIINNNLKAQAGTLDPTFGNGGLVVAGNLFSTGNYSIIQNDGKIIVAGADTGISLYRFNPDGSYDNSFGIDGHFYYNILGRLYGPELKTFALQSNGKIVCASRYFNAGHTYVGITRCNPDGTIDSSFGYYGLDSLYIDKINTATGLVVQTDGKIVISGDVHKNEYDEKRTFLCRYMPDGGLDPTFGESGIIVSNYSQATTSNSLIIRPDGKIVRGSTYDMYGGRSPYMLESFNQDGSIDVSFGINGTAKYIFGLGQEGEWNNNMYAMALQQDDKIVCTGISGKNEDILMAVCRFNADGSIDEAFGEDGGYITSYKNNVDVYSFDITLQPDGKIITIGGTSSSQFSTLLLIRYLLNGQLDPTFGENGISAVNSDTATLSASSVYYLPDGKILTTGQANPIGPKSYILLARFNSDVVLAANFKEVKATQNNETITITWQTLNESGTKSFTVERSSNANDYAGINTVPAKGVASSYSYTDKNPLSGISYYRIRENAANGTNTFSPVVKVEFNDNGIISLYPNPAKNTVIVKGLNKTITATIRITDMNGREISKQTFTQSSSATLNIRAFAQGSYFVLVEENGKVTKLRIVKE